MQEFWRLVRFAFVGLVSAASYALVSWSLVRTGMTTIMVATIVAYVVSATISYLGHVYITFAVAPDHASLLSRYLVVLAVSFVLALVITWAITDVMLAPHYVAILAVIAILPVINYFTQRLWVFSSHLASQHAQARHPDP